jgi:pimeloyl-ACP methyl ester carboxylesterase
MSSTTKRRRPLRRVLTGAAWTLGSLLMLLVMLVDLSWARALWVEDKTAREVAPKQGRWVRAHDVDLYVQEFGDPAAPPLVLTHGTGAWSGTWESNVSAMAKAGYRVIAIDLPPFGFSTRPASRDYSRNEQALRILAFIDGLHSGPVTLLGHSYGGGPAAEAAMLRPELVRHLILLDAAIGLVESQPASASPEGWLDHVFAVRPVRTALIATVGTQPAFSEYWLRQFVARKEAVTASRAAIYQQPFVLKGFTSSLGDWAHQFAHEHGAALSERPEGFRNLQMPVTLMWGAEDTITPLSQAQSIGRLMRNSRLTVLPGVGHIPQIEDIPLFNQRIADVLTESLPRSR